MATKEPVKIVKETPDKLATLYSDGTIMVRDVRLSYVHVDKPYKGKNDKPDAVAKFSLTALIPKARTAVKDLIKAEIDRLLKENKIEDIAADKKFLRNGDLAGKAEYKGFFTVSAREERRPHLRDRNGRKVEPEEAKSTFQSGYWGNVLIRPWYQDAKGGYGTRINAGLSALQFVRIDETFGDGGIDDEDVDARFGKLDDDDSGFGGSSDAGLDDL